MTPDIGSLTTTQIDRLGERLRTTETISEQDLLLLQSFRQEHAEALRRVQEAISSTLGRIPQTSRIKTVRTLHDKLRRQPIKLSRVQDIGGVRIVKDMDRAEQDRLADELIKSLPHAKRLDRRATPSYGYRALHVIVRDGRCNVEVQVRTELQDLWAQVVERLADHWGRQIRYGGEPTDPDEPAGTATRGDLWTIVKSLSEAIDQYEELELRKLLTARRLGQPQPPRPAPGLEDLRLKIDISLLALRQWAETAEGL